MVISNIVKANQVLSTVSTISDVKDYNFLNIVKETLVTKKPIFELFFKCLTCGLLTLESHEYHYERIRVIQII